jgi:hypothetical protein
MKRYKEKLPVSGSGITCEPWLDSVCAECYYVELIFPASHDKKICVLYANNNEEI